ncbi:hypothetical protein [Streptomyces chrestomyceticus]|uniref:hypothetical protein n=1 Tax=Streptomyces chrestomyceticus TaxID=68185 RepID=UPI00340F3D97
MSALFGEFVEADVIEQLLGDLLTAVQAGGDRCFPDEGGQVPDAAAGARMQVRGQPHQASGPMMAQIERVLQCLNEVKPVRGRVRRVARHGFPSGAASQFGARGPFVSVSWHRGLGREHGRAVGRNGCEVPGR